MVVEEEEEEEEAAANDGRPNMYELVDGCLVEYKDDKLSEKWGKERGIAANDDENTKKIKRDNVHVLKQREREKEREKEKDVEKEKPRIWCVGDRVRVFWDGENTFFEGTLMKYDVLHFLVKYDDGDEKWEPEHDLLNIPTNQQKDGDTSTSTSTSTTSTSTSISTSTSNSNGVSLSSSTRLQIPLLELQYNGVSKNEDGKYVKTCMPRKMKFFVFTFFFI